MISLAYRKEGGGCWGEIPIVLREGGVGVRYLLS